MSTVRRDTGPAKIAAIPKVNISDPGLSSWAKAVTEWVEVRTGSRGNEAERAVTKRELDAIAGGLVTLTEKKTPQPGEILISLGGGLTASVAIDKFVAAIKNTRLYRDLMQRLDDPTRFDSLSSEIRSVLLKSIASEAGARGADIQRTETLIQDTNRSLAMAVTEITAALGENAAGIRDLEAAYVNSTSATATKVTQLESSLGNYYQDGQPGRAILEEQLTTQASYAEGLRAQYTLKVQAGGALAGFGISATEVNGVPSSAFIISADKFAIVAPNYSGGLTNNPDNNHIPFGVDTNGIYMNTNVYVRGQMRVDTGGKTLIDGLRGSVNLSASGSAWSDTAARQAVWSALGNSGSATNNNHLVIGDTVTIKGTGSPPSFIETRSWMGSSWQNPGVVINGNLLVDGSLAAQKIDTRGLTIKDTNGNVILGAGVGLNWSQIFNQPSSIYNTNITIGADGQLLGAGGGQVSLTGLGAGALATQNYAAIGANVTFPDGTVMGTGDFVNRLSRIGSGNIGVFMESAAIGNAYIGNAAVETLNIAGGMVTTTSYDEGISGQNYGGENEVCSVTLNMPAGSSGTVIHGFVNILGIGSDGTAFLIIRRNSALVKLLGVSFINGYQIPYVVTAFDSSPAEGANTYAFSLAMPGSGPGSGIPFEYHSPSITAVGAKR